MQADFFLACPGTRMPLCHNLIEALSCGSIPIIQYHKYLTPELIDGENCLTFHDEDTLRQAIQRAMEMPETEILKMRAAALRYYEDNLTEGQFAKRLLDTPSKQVTLASQRLQGSHPLAEQLYPRRPRLSNARLPSRLFECSETSGGATSFHQAAVHPPTSSVCAGVLTGFMRLPFALGSILRLRNPREGNHLCTPGYNGCGGSSE